MIYTVTLNPALDYCVYTDNLVMGKTNRSNKESIFFGGKGINVSRVLCELDKNNTALGFVAGFTGDALCDALDSFGVKNDFIKLKSGLTRINVKLKADVETEINAQGPDISTNDISRLYAKLESLTCGDTLVLAGSIPKSMPKDIYEKILSRLYGRGIRFVVDASGELLKNTLKYNPWLIKPNKDELEEICKRNLSSTDDIVRAAKELQQQGAVNVLVSLGKDGAVLVDEHGKIHTCSAIKGIAVNTVGSGDSMVAGFIAGADRGYENALLLGTVCGAATAFSADLATKEKIDNLLTEKE